MELDLAHDTHRYLGLYERELHKWFRSFSDGIETAVDVGAAEGEYTLYFLMKTSAKKVFAFEPLEENRQIMLANLTLNHLAENERLFLSPRLVGREASAQMCTLDGIFSELATPCLIKLDVEGAEQGILEASRRVLELPGTRWIIETHSQQLEENCIKILKQYGYKTRIIKNAWWRFFWPEERPIAHNRWLIAQK